MQCNSIWLKGVATSAILVASSLVITSANAAEITLGTATGGIAVYYNIGGSENPGNVAYTRSQFSSTITNGGHFFFDETLLDGFNSFESIFSGQAPDSQFGLDAVQVALTSDGSVVTPTLQAFDNTNGTVAGATPAEIIDFAISDYKGGSVTGPGDSAAGVTNSLIRGGDGDGSAIELGLNFLSEQNGIFTVEIDGVLHTDGLIHWYNPAFPLAPFADEVFFRGILNYNSNGDDGTDRIDFYAGAIELYIKTPEPASIALFGLGLLGLGVARRRRKSMVGVL